MVLTVLPILLLLSRPLHWINAYTDAGSLDRLSPNNCFSINNITVVLIFNF